MDSREIAIRNEIKLMHRQLKNREIDISYYEKRCGELTEQMHLIPGNTFDNPPAVVKPENEEQIDRTKFDNERFTKNLIALLERKHQEQAN